MFDESGDGGGLEEEFDRDYCGECDEDLKIISTPRLRIMEAQVFDQKNGDEDEENSVLESIIVQNDEVNLENDNQNFLRELDSAIESIQKWKQRPELVEEQSSDLISESELKFEYNLVDEEVKIRHADEEKIHSLEELLSSPRVFDDDDGEQKRFFSQNLLRMKQLEEMSTNDLLEAQLAESKVLEEGLQLENGLSDLEIRLRRYNEELDLILSVEKEY